MDGNAGSLLPRYKETATSTSQLQPRLKGGKVAYAAPSSSPSSLELEVPDSPSGWSDRTSPLVVSVPSPVLVAEHRRNGQSDWSKKTIIYDGKLYPLVFGSLISL